MRSPYHELNLTHNALFRKTIVLVPSGGVQNLVEIGVGYRERVYCYELYHQMRCIWPPTSPFVLNGEVDKAGHQLMRERGIGSKVPDMLVHTPGNMNGNYAIIEVKSCEASITAILEDLSKISQFIDRAEYKRGIQLIFGQDAITCVNATLRRAPSNMKCHGIEFWVHDTPEEPARCLVALQGHLANVKLGR